jgi:ribosomal protein L11 methyltransferase
MKAVRTIAIAPVWEEREQRDGELLLRIGLGRKRLAFGFGAHETTSLMLSLLGSLYGPRAPRPATVLDVGCGSGILSIACARLGARKVLGLDLADEALLIAPENAAANGAGAACRFAKTPVADVRGRFDLVVANLPAPVLRGVRKALLARSRGGILVLGGFKDADSAELLASYESSGLRLRSDFVHHGWHAALLRA